MLHLQRVFGAGRGCGAIFARNNEEHVMSVLFGPFIQQGYVVPDIDLAISHWVARGVGPFFIEEHIRPPGEYDGRPIQPDLSAAFAFSGDQQIEVIQQHDETETVYRDFLKGHPTGGLQHLAAWVDDIAATLAELAAAGHEYRVRQRFGDAHAYIDTAERPGVMVQLMARIDLMTELFDGIENASKGWDGIERPLRRIDWSSGRPKLDD
jgi:methylmalonyl-CoA/ethylmalonyl-CoA epimerase